MSESTAAAAWRNDVERAVEALLKTIVAGEKYRTSPILVTRTLVKDYREYEALLDTGRPVVGVKRSSGSHLEDDSQETTGHVHRFAIVGLVKGLMCGTPQAAETFDPKTAASERMWDVFKDTVVCLAEDLTLGGLVDALDVDGETETDSGLLEPFGMFEQIWIATRPGDPLKGV